MARKVRHSTLESRSARLKLAVRRKPYSGPSLARGVSLLYRRNKGNGSWVVKASNGHGAYWTKAIAEADDFDNSDCTHILTFYEAQDQAKQLARGTDGAGEAAPVSVDGALTAYGSDLKARNANPYNANWPRLHLTSVLLAKPVQLLTAHELKKWRDGLLGIMAASTINRLCGCLCAALELARSTDQRLQSRQAWEVGLAGLPNAQQARNVILSDDEVREFVASAYELEHQFGLLVDTLAITGARPSQASRLRVDDLHDHPLRPKLMMPKSGKGGGRNRAQKRNEHYSVPITGSYHDPSFALKHRRRCQIFHHDPIKRSSSPIGAILMLRNNAFLPVLAGVFEHGQSMLCASQSPRQFLTVDVTNGQRAKPQSAPGSQRSGAVARAARAKASPQRD